MACLVNSASECGFTPLCAAMIPFPSDKVPPSAADLDATRHHSVYQLATLRNGRKLWWLKEEVVGVERADDGTVTLLVLMS